MVASNRRYEIGGGLATAATGFVVVVLIGLLGSCVLVGPDYPELPIENPGRGPVPPGAAPPLVSAEQAVRIAQDETGQRSAPAGVGRRVDLSSGRTVWEVVFIINRDGRPCGPAPPPGEEQGVCVSVFAGAVIDDQTGAVGYTFEMGGQLWPEE